MSLPATSELSKSLTYLLEIETLAQDICTLKQTKLDLANTLNKLRESFRALQQTQDKRSFIKISSLFIEHTTEECKSIIQKDIEKVTKQYDSTCTELREKVLKLRDVEHEPQIEGIGLRPLSYSEAKGMMQGFGL